MYLGQIKKKIHVWKWDQRLYSESFEEMPPVFFNQQCAGTSAACSQSYISTPFLELGSLWLWIG